jgi:hypothetical protein
VKESIDLVITHISHYDIETSIQILRQVWIHLILFS